MTLPVSACPESASSQDGSERVGHASAAFDRDIYSLRRDLIEANANLEETMSAIRNSLRKLVDFRLQLQSEKTAVDMT